jgi:MFS family permease
MDQEKIKRHEYGNIVSIFWSAFLLIGGAIFVWYYAYIGYMPDFDFRSAITILSAASITAILILIFFIVILIMPGAFWVETWANQSNLKSNWEDKNNEKRFGAVAIWFSVPILVYYLGFIIATYCYEALAVYALIIIFFLYFLGIKKFGLEGKLLHSEIWKMLATSFVSALLAFFPLYMVVTLSFSEISTSKGPATGVGIIVAVFIAIVNVMATMKPKSIHSPIYYSGLGLAAFFIVFTSFEIFHRIPEMIMKTYKFGAIENASIVLKRDGCEAIEKYGLIQGSWEGDKCFMENVTIHSRLGNDMYVEKGELRITIKNSDVLSWSTGMKINKPMSSNTKSSAD